MTDPQFTDAADGDDVEQPSAEPTVSITDTQVSVRRAPRYPRFLIIGGGIGAIVTFALTASFPTDPLVGFPATVGYFLLYGVPAGIVLGALVAIVLDRVSGSRARMVSAELTTVDPLPDEDLDEDLDGSNTDLPEADRPAEKS